MSCNWRRRLRGSRYGARASLIASVRCRHVSVELYIWHCGKKKICAPRVMVRAEDDRSSYIRRASNRRRPRDANGALFPDGEKLIFSHVTNILFPETHCTLCVAVSFSTLDRPLKSRLEQGAPRKKNFVGPHRRGDFFMLVCRSSRNYIRN